MKYVSNNAIEERAEMVVDSAISRQLPTIYQVVKEDYLVIIRNLSIGAFIEGAYSEREELTRWRDPKVELPEDKIRVLVKADVGVVCAIHMGHGEFILDTGVVGYIDADEDECNVIGWRPIWEE